MTEILLASRTDASRRKLKQEGRPSLVPSLDESVSFFRKRGCNGDGLESRMTERSVLGPMDMATSHFESLGRTFLFKASFTGTSHKLTILQVTKALVHLEK